MFFESDQLAEADLLSVRRSPEMTRNANWFSDLVFHRDFSITSKATGRRITFNDLTPVELAKFLEYFAGVLAQAGWRRLNRAQGPSLYFAPQRPRPWHVVWSAVALSCMRIAETPEAADALFYFEDSTWGAAPASTTRPVLNGAVTDISKSKVAAAFERVAGYPLSLDPRVHQGLAVEKSEDNGAHDGRLIQCPRAPMAGKTYQHFAESGAGGWACDLRTTIINRTPRFVVEKTRAAHMRFTIHNARVRFRELDEVFGAEEQCLLSAFAREMELDWAAIDVLRDRASGRLYIVDVNKTDTGPAVDLNMRDREKLKSAIAAGLSELVEARTRAFSPKPGANAA